MNKKIGQKVLLKYRHHQYPGFLQLGEIKEFHRKRGTTWANIDWLRGRSSSEQRYWIIPKWLYLLLWIFG